MPLPPHSVFIVANTCSPVTPEFSVAPMMELTDRHFRFLMRLITRQTKLYTEMLTANAVIHGDRERLLGFDAVEHPVALQLGGNDPTLLAEAAMIGEQWGYDEINLNVGCPSDRVKSGRFGAALMAEPELVGRCVQAMQKAVSVPVTVKCRIGIDRDESIETLTAFVNTVADHGCRHFAVHARKAWLDGLSPKENRTIPPLRYETVYNLKATRPDLAIVINGGIDSWDAIDTHLQHTDGVMIGREAYYNPLFMARVDSYLNVVAQSEPSTDREPDLHGIALEYAEYMQRQLERGINLSGMSRHLIALIQQVPGARAWRRHLSSGHRDTTSAITLVEEALSYVQLHAQAG